MSAPPKYYVMAFRPGIAFTSADQVLQSIGVRAAQRRQLLQRAQRNRSESIAFADGDRLFAAVRQGVIWRQAIGYLPMFDTRAEAEELIAEAEAELSDETPHELVVLEFAQHAGAMLQ